MVARILSIVLLSLHAGIVLAHRPSVQECREASEFIRNAALSRDNGMAREIFVDRLQADLIAIKAHPPALRWFVQDADDEAFLVSAVEQVFSAPEGAVEHEMRTLRSCLARLGAGLT
jgi:hypothetical protein